MKEITIDQTISGTIGGIVDRAGNPAEVQGDWEWFTDSDSVTLEPSGEQLASIKVVPGDVVDDVVNIRAEADADMTDGVAKLIVVFEPLAIVGGQAVFAAGTFAEPEPKPAP